VDIQGGGFFILMKKCSQCKLPKPLDAFSKCNSTKDGRGWSCKECESKRHKKYYVDNAEQLKVLRKQNYCYSEGKREYMRRRRATNPQVKQSGLIAFRKWYATHKETHNSRLHTARAKKAGVTGEHTAGEWLDLKELYGFRCLRCNRMEPEIELTRDHVMSIKNGGSNSIENIQPLCRSCNTAKGAKHIDYR
jgi:5-methylcytosine-specific restriction endonuclease McrA